MIRTEMNVWLTIIVVEALFMLLTRVVLARYWTYSLDAELIRTLLRIVAVVIYWVLLRDRLSSRSLMPEQVRDVRLVLPLLLFLCVPLLVGDLRYMTPGTRALYAATSIFVALKEEITFRALIQHLLARRYGQLTAIVTASLLFTVYHVGVIPLSMFAYGQVVIAGLLLGIVYARTQSLWLVVGLHTVYDALWSLTPLGSGQLLPYGVGLALLGIALCGVLLWGRSVLGQGKTMTV